MHRPKIALVGAGQIGGNLALMAAQKELGDVTLLDIPDLEGIAKGKALDIAQMSPIQGFDAGFKGTTNWDDIKGADVVIVTAGKPRKPGMSRDELLDVNVKIMKDVAVNVKKFCPEAFVVVVSNPLDAMVYALYKITGFNHQQVVGMAGVLDSGRFRYFVAEKLGVSIEDVTAFVLGGHGDDMVPVVQYCAVGGIPLNQMMKKEEIDKIVDRTRKAGGEIVALYKTGSAYYSPAAASITMVESYLRDKKRVLPAAAWLRGEYGLKDMFVGVPVVIGAGGVEKVIDAELSKDDRDALMKSASRVKELCVEVDKRL
ncbi:MAG: malate dehydrogenase [Deltaproteobacteria bacterium]|nr:malate dehydrogenase [Deltaproteobacteria bacterium]